MSDRKYRHRGYQDDGSRSEPARPREPQGPREKPEGPRGRGLGSPTDTVFRCRNCGSKQSVAAASGRDATCGNCNADLHTCTNCAFFDTSCPNECRKPVPLRVVAKTRRNLCELWSPNTVQEFASDMQARAADPRAAFDALFKKR